MGNGKSTCPPSFALPCVQEACTKSVFLMDKKSYSFLRIFLFRKWNQDIMSSERASDHWCQIISRYKLLWPIKWAKKGETEYQPLTRWERFCFTKSMDCISCIPSYHKLINSFVKQLCGNRIFKCYQSIWWQMCKASFCVYNYCITGSYYLRTCNCFFTALYIYHGPINY